MPCPITSNNLFTNLIESPLSNINRHLSFFLVNVDTSIIKSFAEHIDSYIIENKLTNQKFGDLIGVDEATVRKYRKGEILLAHEQRKKITIILKLHYHEIMGYDDPTKKA